MYYEIYLAKISLLFHLLNTMYLVAFPKYIYRKVVIFHFLSFKCTRYMFLLGVISKGIYLKDKYTFKVHRHIYFFIKCTCYNIITSKHFPKETQD
jgi:hypothetical protein